MSDKRATIDGYLMHGEIHVLVDARQPGVSVPADLRENRNLLLKVSYKYAPPDLDVSDWGIRITLQFGRQLYPVQLPWAAVYGAYCLTGDVEAWPAPGEPPPMAKRRGILGVVH